MGGACSKDNTKDTTKQSKSKDAPAPVEKNLGAAAPANDELLDVLIVGAGFTGCSAGHLLDKAGLNVEIHEANDYIGGRCHSTTWKDSKGNELALDLGAQYVGWSQKTIWTLLSDSFKDIGDGLTDGYQLSTDRGADAEVEIIDKRQFQYPQPHAWLGIAGVPPLAPFKGSDALDFLVDLLPLTVLLTDIQLLEAVINLSDLTKTPHYKELDAMTLQDWIDSRWWLSGVTQDLVVISCRAVISMEPKDVSHLWWWWYCRSNGGFLEEVNDTKAGPQQFYLRDGFDSLARRLVKDLTDKNKVILKHPAKSVDYSDPSKVTVTFADGSTKSAKKALISMAPTNAGMLSYSPALPADRQLIQNEVMGKTFKAFMYYDAPWWSNVTGPMKGKLPFNFTGYVGGTSPAQPDRFPDPITIVWAMDNTPKDYEKLGLYPLMFFVVADEVTRLGDKTLDSDWMKAHILDQVINLYSVPDDQIDYVRKPIHFECAVWKPENSIGEIIPGGPVTGLRPNVLSQCPELVNGQNRPEGPGKNLFFGATEYANVTPGYMNGAINNGAEIADKLMAEVDGAKKVPLFLGVQPNENPDLAAAWEPITDDTLADFEQLWKIRYQADREWVTDPKFQMTLDEVKEILDTYTQDLVLIAEYMQWVAAGSQGDPPKGTEEIGPDFVAYECQDTNYAIHAKWIGILVKSQKAPISADQAVLPLQALLYVMWKLKKDDTLSGILFFCVQVGKQLVDNKDLTLQLNMVIQKLTST